MEYGARECMTYCQVDISMQGYICDYVGRRVSNQ